MNTQFERNAIDGKDEWLTPPEIIKELGPFDLDPCAPINRPWPTAQRHYTKEDNGLEQYWHGRVWCNPPYGKELGKWLSRCAGYRNCIVLTFARVETKAFFKYVWPKAVGIFFIEGRIQFYHVTGVCAGNSAGAPSILIAYNEYNAERLKNCKLRGKYIRIAD